MSSTTICLPVFEGQAFKAEFDTECAVLEEALRTRDLLQLAGLETSITHIADHRTKRPDSDAPSQSMQAFWDSQKTTIDIAATPRDKTLTRLAGTTANYAVAQEPNGTSCAQTKTIPSLPVNNDRLRVFQRVSAGLGEGGNTLRWDEVIAARADAGLSAGYSAFHRPHPEPVLSPVRLRAMRKRSRSGSVGQARASWCAANGVHLR